MLSMMFDVYEMAERERETNKIINSLFLMTSKKYSSSVSRNGVEKRS